MLGTSSTNVSVEEGDVESETKSDDGLEKEEKEELPELPYRFDYYVQESMIGSTVQEYFVALRS